MSLRAKDEFVEHLIKEEDEKAEKTGINLINVIKWTKDDLRQREERIAERQRTERFKRP